MRRRPVSREHVVYWPAFADVLTALVVVLLCTFAVVSKTPHPPVPNPVPSIQERGSNDGLPQSQWQYENEILTAKRDLLLPDLLLAFPGRVARGEWLEIRLCTFGSSLISEEELRVCEEGVRFVADAIDQETFLKGLEESYSVVLPAFYLRGRTGTSNPESSVIKMQLKAAQDYFLGKRGISSERMTEQQYVERGNRNMSDISLVLSGRLRDLDHKNIQDHWDHKDWDWLKEFKLMVNSRRSSPSQAR